MLMGTLSDDELHVNENSMSTQCQLAVIHFDFDPFLNSIACSSFCFAVAAADNICNMLETLISPCSGHVR